MWPAIVIFGYSEGLIYTGIIVALNGFLLGTGIFILKQLFSLPEEGLSN